MTASTGIAETEALLVLLRREHELLLAGDLEGIEAIAREKHAAIEQLERLNLDTLHLARPGNDSGARLRALAIECHRQNEINGGMVEAGLRHARQTLAILQGQNPQAEIYTRRGDSTDAAAGRSIARI